MTGKILGRVPIFAKERDTCEIPATELRGSALTTIVSTLGNLIEFRYAGSNVKLIIGGVVGHLPVSDTHVLVISPKFPLSNMSRMVWTSRVDVIQTAPINRFYEIAKNDSYSLDVMLRLFAQQLGELLVEGIHRAYKRSERVSIPRPHIDFKRTAQRYWLRGIVSSAAITDFDLSATNWANSLIRTAARIALQHSSKSEALVKEKEIFREVDRALQTVPFLRTAPDRRDLSTAARSMPSFRKTYASAMPTAFEIVAGSSLLLDRHGAGVLGPSFLIDLEDVFEAYIRNVLRMKLGKRELSIDVLDGNNSKWYQDLFIDTDRYIVKPDLIFRHKGTITAVADAKYTSKKKEEHRYQVLTHAQAAGCSRAILMYPANEKVLPGLHRVGETKAGVTLFEYGLSLDADLDAAEAEMADNLAALAAPPAAKAVAA
jgi:hypothetical protein